MAWQELTNFFRVVFALLLREARVKYGRTRFGYAWALIEPVFLISMMSALFSIVRNPPFGDSFGLFFATGILPFQLFRHSTSFVGSAFRSNKALFNYPIVKPIDAAIARMILEVATFLIVIVIVLGFLVVVLDVITPYNIPMIALAIGLMALLGFGIGLTNATLTIMYPSWQNTFNLIMGPSFFVSGIFYTMVSIPVQYREILAWNPIIHGVEAFRIGYYPNYRSPDLDLDYLFWWGFGFTFFGFLIERFLKWQNA